MPKWVHNKTAITDLHRDRFYFGGFYDPSLEQATAFLGLPIADLAVAELPDEQHPDPRTERHDATSPTKKRLATAAEIAAYDAAQVDAEGAASIDDKRLKAIVLTLLFFINEVRTQPTTVFPALTATQVRDRFLTIFRGL